MFSKLHNKAILALICANFIWGAASPIFKVALQNITPFTLAFLRFYFAALIFLPFTYKDLLVKKKDWLNLFLLSLFGIFINITFFFFGLKQSPAINAPIIASSGPIFIYLFSIFFLKEKPHPRILFGTMISLSGVLLIVGQPILQQGLNGELVGNLFFILATLGSVGHVIFSKEILANNKAKTITFWSFVIGSYLFFPFFINEVIKYNPLSTLDWRGVMGLIFGIFLSSALAYFLYEWSLQILQAQEAGLFMYLDPIAAIIIAIPLLGETISVIFMLGSLLVFGGIYIAENRIHYHPFHKLSK